MSLTRSEKFCDTEDVYRKTSKRKIQTKNSLIYLNILT